MKEAEVSFWDWFALTDRTVDTTVCLTQWEAQEDSYSMLYLACSFHVDFQSKHLDLFGHLKICFRCEFICKKKEKKRRLVTIKMISSPEPSGMDLTKVGSILTVAVGLVSRASPFSISLRKRDMMSRRVSSENRMAYKYLSI